MMARKDDVAPRRDIRAREVDAIFTQMMTTRITSPTASAFSPARFLLLFDDVNRRDAPRAALRVCDECSMHSVQRRQRLRADDAAIAADPPIFFPLRGGEEGGANAWCAVWWQVRACLNRARASRTARPACGRWNKVAGAGCASGMP